jgi:transposase
MESFFTTLKQELVYQRQYQTRKEAKQDIFEYIQAWYNRRRIILHWVTKVPNNLKTRASIKWLPNLFLAYTILGENQWRNLESKYPAWQSVYYYCRKWQHTSVWEQILDALIVKERKRQTRQESPSLLAVDSQSVKIVNFISLEKGIDGAKKLNGRKRYLAVDTLRLPWAMLVTAASVSDTAAGCQLVDQVKGKAPRLQKIAADHGYKSGFIVYVSTNQQWSIEIAQRPESAQGFVPQKNRWPVERSFGWLNFRRRLAKDYEKTIKSSQAVLQIAFISFLIRRLAK